GATASVVGSTGLAAAAPFGTASQPRQPVRSCSDAAVAGVALCTGGWTPSLPECHGLTIHSPTSPRPAPSNARPPRPNRVLNLPSTGRGGTGPLAAARTSRRIRSLSSSGARTRSVDARILANRRSISLIGGPLAKAGPRPQQALLH